MSTSAAEARKRKILARAEERMASITGGGAAPAAESQTEDTASKASGLDSAELSYTGLDNLTPAAPGGCARHPLHAAPSIRCAPAGMLDCGTHGPPGAQSLL